MTTSEYIAKLREAAVLSMIRKGIITMDQADALIQQWSDRDLGPNPLDTAVGLEAFNQIFHGIH